MADQAVATASRTSRSRVWTKLGAKVSASKKQDGVTSGTQTPTVNRAWSTRWWCRLRPFTTNLLGEGTGLSSTNGFVKVDHECRTGVANVWAVGDLRAGMLAHKGREGDGRGSSPSKHAEVNYNIIPSVIYTAPEIAWVGLTEQQVSQWSCLQDRVSTQASGRARAMEAAVGFCKMISATDTDEVLGVHIIGPMAGELIAEAVLAMEYSASTEDFQRTIHAHPTLSEAVHEAALAADKIAIDFPNR
jgi:dihydrolipoamide dehydrogenase